MLDSCWLARVGQGYSRLLFFSLRSKLVAFQASKERIRVDLRPERRGMPRRIPGDHKPQPWRNSRNILPGRCARRKRVEAHRRCCALLPGWAVGVLLEGGKHRAVGSSSDGSGDQQIRSGRPGRARSPRHPSRSGRYVYLEGLHPQSHQAASGRLRPFPAA